MVIPKGVNQIEFYRAAKAKGVKVTSRYVGVYPNNNKTQMRWMALKRVDGKLKTLALHPFTEEGEFKAHQAFERYTNEVEA